MVDDKVLEKIQKLLALARSDNEHEAALAAQRAQELMLKHDVAAEEVAAHQGRQRAGVDTFKYHAGRQTWEQFLFDVVARGFNCRALFTEHKNRGKVVRGDSMWLLGRPDDAAVAAYMYVYLHRELDRLCGSAWNRIWYGAQRMRKRAGTWEPGEGAGLRVDGKEWKRDWRMGAVTVINRRLQEARVSYGDQVTALVVRRDQELEDWLQEKGVQQAEDGYRVKHIAAFIAGKDAGEHVGLQRPLEGRSDEQRGLLE